MKTWTMVALVAVLVALGGPGSPFPPAVSGQTRARASTPRALDVFAGRGSRIGVSVRDIEDSDPKAARPASSGVLVDEVTEDSPAEKAGIRRGDVVVEFDGERVRSARQFTRLVQETPDGRKVQAAVLRDGQKVNVTIEPRESGGFDVFVNGEDMRAFRDLGRNFSDIFPALPPVPPAPPAGPSAPAPPAPPAFPDFESYIWRSSGTLGITVDGLTDQLAQYFGTKDGVLVTSVSDGSSAAKAGLKAGDVVTSINGSDVTSPSDLRRRTQRLQNGDDFTVGVMRDRKPLTLKGKVEGARSRRTYRSDV
jgi:serine protease Do